MTRICGTLRHLNGRMFSLIESLLSRQHLQSLGSRAKISLVSILVLTLASVLNRLLHLQVATNDDKIHAISRRLLDPRRPKRKPTSEEQEEMLIEYDPVIPNDPKQVISHKYEASSLCDAG